MIFASLIVDGFSLQRHAQIMFAGSNKWNIVVLEPKGKPLGMEIVKVKTKNERGQSVKRIQIAGFYRDGDRVCVAEKSGQVFTL